MVTAQGSLPLQKEKVNKRMPYASEAQRGFFNANRNKMEKQGVDMDEWNKASKGKSLPGRAPKRGIGHRISRMTRKANG